MPISAVLGFWIVAALLVVVPGPDWTFAIGAGLDGRAVPAAAGIALGYLTMTIVVAAGVGALMAASPVALTVVAVAGGVYLITLGVGTLRHPATPGRGSAAGARSVVATIGQGLAVSALNPKALLVFVALLPQFTSPAAAWPMAGQLALLGLLFTLTCGVVVLAVGTGAQRVLAARPAVGRVVSRLAGGCMVAIGAALLLERALV